MNRLHSDNTSLSQISNQRRCSICNEPVNDEDLVHLSNDLTVHFKCYIEIQDKLCSVCGNPFENNEELLYCVEHKEYFHFNDFCLKKHMKKHMPFRKAKYDMKKNRIAIQEDLDENKISI